MMLFIDVDRDKSTGWNCYDFVVNRLSPNGDSAPGGRFNFIYTAKY